MIDADLHSHTRASHGADEPAAMVAAAAAAGLAWFGLSEHAPLPGGFSCPLYLGDLARDFPLWAQEVLRLKEQADASGHGPRILLGLELDWIPSKLPAMRALVNAWPFDYVLGSLHHLDGMSVGAAANWTDAVTRPERRARFAACFHEMASLAESGLVQAVAHADFVKLRAFADFHAWLDSPQAREAIDHALTALARTDTALEVSSAGLRQPFAEPYPCQAILRRAAALGVPICFGSDAHAARDVAARFRELADYARACGYTHSRIFVQRRPLSRAF